MAPDGTERQRHEPTARLLPEIHHFSRGIASAFYSVWCSEWFTHTAQRDIMLKHGRMKEFWHRRLMFSLLGWDSALKKKVILSSRLLPPSCGGSMSLHFSFKIPLLASMAGFKAFNLGHLERDAHFYRFMEQSQKNNDKKEKKNLCRSRIWQLYPGYFLTFFFN